MIIEELIPCISLIGLGLLLLRLLSRKDFEFTLAEKILYIIVLFSAITVIPWSYFGLQKIIILFQLWPLILALIGMVYLGIELYQNYKKIIPLLEQANNIKNIIQNKLNELSITNKTIVLVSVIAILLFFYSIFNLVLSYRDFDALWMYIPDAMWYYRMNYIPVINPLNFNVSTKEPFVSLLFSFALYTTGSLSIKLLPIIFVIGWCLTVYVFIEKIWQNTSKALMGTLLFILSPFMYYIFTFWVYYQEMYVSFFYAVTLLALFNLLQYQKEPEKYKTKNIQYFYLLIGGLSFALSLLSKLSGWSLLFVILVLYPFPKKTRIIQSVLIGFITVFLFFKASTTYYIGIGIFIVLYYVLILFLHWKKPGPKDQTIYQNPGLHLTGLIIIPAGILLGGFWLYDTLQRFQQYSTSFQDLYLLIQSLQLKLTFQGTPLNSAHFLLESAQATDFISIVLYLLVGNMFVLFWILPKVRVLLNEEVKYFVLWIVSFFMLWLTYQGLTSIRYLSVILVPIIILVTHGFHKLYQDVVGPKKTIPLSLGILASFLSFASYYYPITPGILLNGLQTKTLNQQFLLSAYNYYKNAIFYLIGALVLSVIVLLLIKYLKRHEIKLKIPNKQTSIILKASCLILIVFIPFAIPSFVFVSVGGNTTEFNGIYNYYQRPAYTEIVNALLNENSPSSGIIAVDMPGLPIYLNQPELDLYAHGESFPPLSTTNVTSLLQLLLNPIDFAKTNYNLSISSSIASETFSFDYFIVPTYGNNIYKFYATSIYESSMLFPLLYQKSLFNLIYQNSDFLLFKRVYTNPVFSGIINTYLEDGSAKTSVLGMVQQATTFTNNISLKFIDEIPKTPADQLVLNATINGQRGSKSFSFETSTNMTLKTSTSTINYNIPLSNITQNNKSFTINNITLTMFLEGKNYFSSKTYVLEAGERGFSIQYDTKTNTWDVTTGLGLQPR